MTAKGLRATFQGDVIGCAGWHSVVGPMHFLTLHSQLCRCSVRFPGDPLVYEFKSWEEVNDEFVKRGYDPKNANIHTAKSGEIRIYFSRCSIRPVPLPTRTAAGDIRVRMG